MPTRTTRRRSMPAGRIGVSAQSRIVTPSRDRRFVAVHRGGLLDRESHRFLARWAADCAERVLHLFTRQCDDIRPRNALEVCRAWANGEVKTGVAMKASLAAHAAAREATDKAAIAAARAAGQAVATAHMGDHSMGALLYAMKALEASGAASGPELALQLAKLPAHLLPAASEGIFARLKGLGILGVPSEERQSQTSQMPGRL